MLTNVFLFYVAWDIVRNSKCSSLTLQLNSFNKLNYLLRAELIQLL